MKSFISQASMYAWSPIGSFGYLSIRPRALRRRRLVPDTMCRLYVFFIRRRNSLDMQITFSSLLLYSERTQNAKTAFEAIVGNTAGVPRQDIPSCLLRPFSIIPNDGHRKTSTFSQSQHHSLSLSLYLSRSIPISRLINLNCKYNLHLHGRVGLM
jgi:hypothetical protein